MANSFSTGQDVPVDGGSGQKSKRVNVDRMLQRGNGEDRPEV